MLNATLIVVNVLLIICISLIIYNEWIYVLVTRQRSSQLEQVETYADVFIATVEEMINYTKGRKKQIDAEYEGFMKAVRTNRGKMQVEKIKFIRSIKPIITTQKGKNITTTILTNDGSHE